MAQFHVFGKCSMPRMVKYWTNSLTIWSHWSRCRWLLRFGWAATSGSEIRRSTNVHGTVLPGTWLRTSDQKVVVQQKSKFPFCPFLLQLRPQIGLNTTAKWSLIPNPRGFELMTFVKRGEMLLPLNLPTSILQAH